MQNKSFKKKITQICEYKQWPQFYWLEITRDEPLKSISRIFQVLGYIIILSFQNDYFYQQRTSLDVFTSLTGDCDIFHEKNTVNNILKVMTAHDSTERIMCNHSLKKHWVHCYTSAILRHLFFVNYFRAPFVDSWGHLI